MGKVLDREDRARAGKIVFRGNDAYNPVEVIDYEETRSLHFGTAGCQSEMSLKKPLRASFRLHPGDAAFFIISTEPALSFDAWAWRRIAS